MKVSKAGKIWLDYHQIHSKKTQLFRPKIKTHFNILEKEIVDEIIFRTTKHRDRLMLGLIEVYTI